MDDIEEMSVPPYYAEPPLDKIVHRAILLKQ
jgi:hypothetical protein